MTEITNGNIARPIAGWAWASLACYFIPIVLLVVSHLADSQPSSNHGSLMTSGYSDKEATLLVSYVLLYFATLAAYPLGLIFTIVSWAKGERGWLNVISLIVAGILGMVFLKLLMR